MSKGTDMKRRDLVARLEAADFRSDGGTKHEKFIKGSIVIMVPRHREIPEGTAKSILKQAGLL